MTRDELQRRYEDYIDCLNRQDWDGLGRFVGDDAEHNGRPLGLAGYRRMLEGDFAQIPDLVFRIDMLAVDPPLVAARLRFDCSPQGTFLGLKVEGRRITFTENVFYRFGDGRIRQVWSILDKSEIEAQLEG